MKAFVQQTMKVPFDILSEKNYRTFLWMLLKYGNSPRFVKKKISFNNNFICTISALAVSTVRTDFISTILQ